MGFLDILFPIVCLECGRSGGYICKNCLNKVEIICRLNPATNTFTVFRYEGVVRKAIIALKYKFAFDIAKELADVCVNKLTTHPLSPNTILVPIPLHQARQRWRGFNQSEVVGELISIKMGWEFEPNLLVRTTASKPQVGLPKSERVRNMRGKFAVNSSLRSKTRGQNFLVFDDVLTTGSTIKEAMSVLRKSGAKEVTGLTIAK